MLSAHPLQLLVKFTVILLTYQQNIIRNGDFQGYATQSFFNAGGELFKTFPSNLSEWYNKNIQQQIQIKKKLSSLTTFTCDLSTNLPIILCQKVLLIPQRKYQLKYSGYCEIRIEKVNFTVLVNNNLVSWMYIRMNDTYLSKVDYFYPFTDINEICFSQTHQPTIDYQNFSWMIGVGGLLDNVSLIQAHLQNLTFSVKVVENTSKIFLVCYAYNQDYLEQFAKQVTLFVSGVKTENLQYVSDMAFFIEANITSSFHDSEIELLPSGREDINPLVYFHTEIIASGKEFYSLSEKEKKVLLVAQNLFSIVSTSVKTFTKSMQAVVCSYFIVSILNFDLLLLLYVFLDIGIFPEFAREIYYEFLQQYFSTNSIFWILSKLELVQSQTVITMNEQQERIPELVSKQLNNQRWLGWYGVSSQVFNNNVDSFFQLLLLVFKIALAKFFLSCVSAESRKKHKLNFRAGMVFVVEIISCIPCFVLSAMPCILESASKIQQIWEKIAQVLLLFVCFFVLALYMLGKRRKRVLIQNLDKKTIPKQQRQNKILYIYQYHQAIDLLPTLLIPFFISLKCSKIFFLLNGFVIILKTSSLGYFAFRMAKNSFFQTILQSFINIIWLAHHLIFLLLFSQNLKSDKAPSTSKIIVLGISSVLTILIGFFVQSINLLVTIVKLVVKVIKVICKCLRKKELKLKQKGKSRDESVKKKNHRNLEKNKVSKDQRQRKRNHEISDRKNQTKRGQKDKNYTQMPAQQTLSKPTKIKVKFKVRPQKRQNNKNKLKIIEDVYLVDQKGKKKI